jgi:transposase
MRRIGEDVAEKLDYTPGRFTVERHIRGKWACAACETLVQAPVPAHIIDKGIPCHRPAHWSQLMIGTMEPPRDRHIEASP